MSRQRVEYMITKAVKKLSVQSIMADRILNIVEPQVASLVVQVPGRFPDWKRRRRSFFITQWEFTEVVRP